ncbi:MAG: hypothetical protein HDT16_06160 [Oscillibacter sp.]|nr:hypothetical protein [Oscillibacter sp.]
MEIIQEAVTTALGLFSDGAIKKMEESEAKRDREFSYKLKELEFYKGNYDKEIKNIFDGWFNLLQNSLLANSKHLVPDQKKKYQKALDDALRPDNAMKLKINTMKYGGTETGKALALFSQVTYGANDSEEFPQFAIVYVTCVLLSTLKREILGQDITPLTIVKVLISDFWEKSDLINESRCYVEEKMAELFPNEQMI